MIHYNFNQYIMTLLPRCNITLKTANCILCKTPKQETRYHYQTSDWSAT